MRENIDVDRNRCITDEEFAKQVVEVPAVVDRVRLVGLDHTSLLGNARERSLRRELAIKTVQFGKDAPQVKLLAERLRLQQALSTQIKAETERSETVPPERQNGIFILHGRVVNRERLGQPGLTVSAVDRAGRPVTFMCTDDRGYFKLEVSARDSAAKDVVFLQASGKDGTVLFRGTEAHNIVSESIVYREIVLGEQKPEEPCPPPPEQQPETVRVPDVVGRPEAEATELLKAAKLSVGERKTRPAPKQLGLVLAQDPKAGMEVIIGTPVDLVIGVAKQVAAPDVVGQKLELARRVLTKAALTVGTVNERTSEQVGVILEQDPQAGKEVPPGTPVNLVVGKAN